MELSNLLRGEVKSWKVSIGEVENGEEMSINIKYNSHKLNQCSTDWNDKRKLYESSPRCKCFLKWLSYLSQSINFTDDVNTCVFPRPSLSFSLFLEEEEVSMYRWWWWWCKWLHCNYRHNHLSIKNLLLCKMKTQNLLTDNKFKFKSVNTTSF